MTHLSVKNATTHNLKNISLEIPRNNLVVFTGVSGSGKSSLVFDTIYTEAQRQLVDIFSSFARTRLPQLSRPPVDEITNLSTAIVIDQKRLGKNLRSTVGTATELFTYLRLLYSRAGEPSIGPSFYFSFNNPEGMCPACKGLGKRIVIDTDMLLDKTKSIKDGAITHPDYKVGGFHWREMLMMDLFDCEKNVGAFSAEELNTLLYADSVPIKKKHGAGTQLKNFTGIAKRLEDYFVNKGEDESDGASKNVYQTYMVYSDCDECGGTRINERARSVRFEGETIDALVTMELSELDTFLSSAAKTDVTKPLITKMRNILSHLIDIGVGYLSLNRAVSTLSGGESQRVKMARQLDCDLIDMMYILDEPSIGLHARDNAKLIDMLFNLRDKGNSVFVVEHDPDIMRAGDWIVDVGPEAGTNGGNILFTGTYDALLQSDTLTSRCIQNPTPLADKRKAWHEYYQIENANIHNLKNVSIKIPKGVLTCVTGVAGSGKSSLIHDVFVKEHPDAVVVDQSAIAKSSRSNALTYIGVFDLIRKEIAQATNANPSLFSFNSKGACPKCKGMGYINIEMSFLDDVKLTCDECGGKRYKDDVLRLTYRGKNIFEILQMTVAEAKDFFSTEKVRKQLTVLADVGLPYLEIGQALSTLSGGESQRIKLASELHKKGNIYVMDEPTTGLHMADIECFLAITKRLVEKNNTVIIIEHNLDIIRHADWIIDMGPEGGGKGGEILFEGTPDDLINCQNSFTGNFLKALL